jgi:rare lipoprotein A (peptidoglycan hydrolase)
MSRHSKNMTMALAMVATAFLVAAFAADGLASTGAAVAPPEATAESPSLAPAGATVQGTGLGHRHRHRHRATIATWFGPGLYGRRTACGQVLTPHLVGVANKTLPCGSLVSLSYRGHHLVAPVIDRGPYVAGVTWDLTTMAAHTLGVYGRARLRARVIGLAPNTPTLGMTAPPKSAPSGGSVAEPTQGIVGVPSTEATESTELGQTGTASRRGR